MTRKEIFGMVTCIVLFGGACKTKPQTNFYANWMFEFDKAAISHHDTLLSICPVSPGYKFKIVHLHGDSFLMTDSGLMVAEWAKDKENYHISDYDVLDSVDRSWKKVRVYFGKHDFGYPIMDGQFASGRSMHFTAYQYLPQIDTIWGDATELLNRDTTAQAELIDTAGTGAMLSRWRRSFTIHGPKRNGTKRTH